jgi:diaminopimelate decarboxylase
MSDGWLSWEVLEGLAAEYGEEFYLLDLRAVERNVVEWLEALRTAYPRSDLAYSYKTEICRLVDERGGLAEVVSGLEIDLAERLGVAGSRLVFNGPYKTPSDIRRVLRAGGLVFLDALYEVPAVAAAAAGDGSVPLRVGLRCNLSRHQGAPSRFGFDTAGAEFAEAIERLSRLPGCTSIELHAHHVPPERSPADYAFVVEQLSAAARRVPENRRPRIIDIGGGFFSRMPASLATQFGHVPTPMEYARAIGDAMRLAFPGSEPPHLLVEPGMAVVADAASLAARVVGVKSIGGRRVALVATTRYSVQPTFASRTLPASVHRRKAPGVSSGPLDVVGTTCMEHDVLFHDFPQSLAPGDWLVVHQVGAYTNVLRPPFITPCPPVVAIASQGPPFAAKRREDSADVLRAYQAQVPFPPSTESRRPDGSLPVR